MDVSSIITATTRNTIRAASCYWVAVFVIGMTVAVAISPTSPLPHERITTKLINETCQKTQFVETCIDGLSSSIKANTSDMMTLIEIAVEVALNKANKVSYHITHLLEKAHFPDMEQCLSDCSESYQDVIAQLNDCDGEIDFQNDGPSKSKTVVTEFIDAALSDVTTCENGCKSDAENGDILTKHNMEVSRYLTVVNDIVKQNP